MQCCVSGSALFWEAGSGSAYQSEMPDPDQHHSQKQDQNQNLWAVEAKNGAMAAHPGAVEAHKGRPEGSPWSRKRACRPLFAEICTVVIPFMSSCIRIWIRIRVKIRIRKNWKTGSGSAWKWSGSVTLLCLTLNLTKFYFTSVYLQGHNGRLMCCIWHPTKVSYRYQFIFFILLILIDTYSKASLLVIVFYMVEYVT